MQCPAQRATYQLEGPRGPVGKVFWVEVVVRDPTQPESPSLTPQDLGAATLLDPAELGPNWSLIWFEGQPAEACGNGPAYATFYRNTEDYPSAAPAGRVVGYVVEVETSVAVAEERVTASHVTLPTVLESGLGDGTVAFSSVSPTADNPVALAEYTFRVGPVLAGVSVSQDNTPVEELSAQAWRFALLAEEHLRTLSPDVNPSDHW